MLESLFIKVASRRPVTLLKETPTQVFSCEYCKIFNSTYFEEHLRTAASESYRNSGKIEPGYCEACVRGFLVLFQKKALEKL